MRTVRSRRSAVTRASAGWLLTVLLLRLVILHPERCPSVDRESVRSGAEAAVGWLTTNQNPDGTWLYRYDRSVDLSIDDYNIVRHAGVLWSLEQAATAGFDGAAESADAGYAWTLENLTVDGDRVALGTTGQLRVGASALLAVALVERRERTGDTSRDDLMRSLAAFLEAQVEPTGAVLAYWDTRTEQPVPETYSPFFTGEVWWALIRLHETFGDPDTLDAVERVGTYLATSRDDSEGYWPGVPDHWAAYGLAEHADSRGGAQDRIAYAGELARLFGIQVRWESQRTDSLFSWATRGRRTLGAGLGTIGEALGSLWLASRASDGDVAHRAELRERAMCVTGMLLDRQASAADAEDEPEPERVVGAWFQFDVTQMDDQQHALSALLLTLDMLDAEMGR